MREAENCRKIMRVKVETYQRQSSYLFGSFPLTLLYPATFFLCSNALCVLTPPRPPSRTACRTRSNYIPKVPIFLTHSRLTLVSED